MSEEINNIKLKKGSYEIIKRINDEDIIEKIEGRIFTYKDMQFGLQGNAKDGYRLTHIESGMLANSKYYNKLNDFKEDIELLYQIIKNNKVHIDGAIERFNKAKNRS